MVNVDLTSSYGVPVIGPAFGRADPNRTIRVAQVLQSARTTRAVNVYMNFETGFAGRYQATDTEPQYAVQRLVQGWHWVDYGAWPFGTWKQPMTSNRLSQGFAAFLAVVNGYGYPIPPISPTTKLQAFPVAGVVSSLRDFAVGVDAYDFHLADWTWGGLARQLGYPYAFGFPTALTGSTSYFRVMPGTPAAHLGGGVNVYSAFALRVGPSWYFEAQAGIDPTQYAAFILETLGIPVPSTGSQITPSVSCAQTNKPTLSRGATGPYVRLAQERLNAWGAKLTVDGVYGPQTAAAVLALQRAHDHEYFGGQQVLVTGDVGPGTWNLLCSSPGTHGPKVPTSPPPSGGASPPCGGVFGTIARSTGLTCGEVEILALGAAATIAVLVLRG